ncbi:MAG: AAA family ATPase [Thermodesulfobacteriota bacterium]
MGRLFVAEVVHARSESQDLQWHFDAIGRLGDAQALGAACRPGLEVDVKAMLAPAQYLAPGALWWVFDWQGALGQAANCKCKHRQPVPPLGWEPGKGSVLLIDEIDKAEADLPNGLLETLGNGGFAVPYLDEPVAIPEGVPSPLVVITTNEERELPAAFVRRCLVLHLRLPDGDPARRDQPEAVRRQDLVDWLLARGKDHFGQRIDCEVLEQAAQQLWTDRQQARNLGLSPPGQAEYLDLLRALDRLAHADAAGQKDLLVRIQGFALRKFAGLC